ncbi:transmembrane protease serine 9-like [Cetorhinus maximus]
MKYSKGLILVFAVLGIILIMLMAAAIILAKLLIGGNLAKPTSEYLHHGTTNKTSVNGTCGCRSLFSGRIVGGTNSMKGEWPWQVSLMLRGSHVCGASIISDRWLISAAHCFTNSYANPSAWKALMGSRIIGQGISRNIRRIHTHPNYSIPIHSNNDIAVLELSFPLIFNDFIQPVCLPLNSTVFPVGQSCTITGWGTLAYQGWTPRILQKAEVKIISDNRCRRTYGYRVSDKMLCAGILEGGVDACQGDSGGPLVCQSPDKPWLLAGIVSFGIKCARPNIPGVYTRVTALRDWVQQETGFQLFKMNKSKSLVIIIVVTSAVLILAAVAAFLLGVFLTQAAASRSSDVFFSVNFRILNIAYHDALATPSSTEFSQLANDIETQIKTLYSTSNLSMQFDNSQIVEFRAGSVIVTLIQQFKGDGSASLPAGTVEKTFQQSLTQVNMSSQSGSLDHFIIDLKSIQFTEISQAEAKVFINSVPLAVLTTLGMSNTKATTVTTDTPTTLHSSWKPTSAVTTPTNGITTSASKSTSSSPTCGSRPAIFSRIVGGTNSMNGEWPWQVSLQIRSHICGASIISDRWLVSAAHCFEGTKRNPSIWKAYMGTVNVGMGIVQTIKTIISHPNYLSNENDFDIAVLELSSPLNFVDVIQPICLPSYNQVFPAGKSCAVTGWGTLSFKGSLPTILQKADVDIINNNTCKAVYGSIITERMLCAGFLEGGVDSCQGDSGGPLACMEPDGTWFLAGIVSFGLECAKPNFPGVYTRVTALRDWLQEQTGV